MQARILVTDDDKHVRFLLATYIRRLGYDVAEAESGEAALRILSEPNGAPIDLMLTDVWMPQMSGVELLKSIRQVNPDLPVVMITASATMESSIDALNAGAFAYLKKPIQNEEVRDVLARGLNKRKELLDVRATRKNLLERYQELEQRLETLQERQQVMAWAAPEDLLSELIRGLRHELGNATTAIKLNLAVLEEEGSDPINLQEHLQDLQISTDHLVDLLGKLREYPRNSLALEAVDLRHILYSTEDIANSQGKPLKTRVNYSLPSSEIIIHAAPLELSRAFTHILRNAEEASLQLPDPSVNINVVIEDNMVEVTISDSGSGFPTELLEKPFSPGFTTKATGGTLRGLGLGLFMARTTVDLHGGNIWLENRAGGGASVHVRLPLAPSTQHIPMSSTS